MIQIEREKLDKVLEALERSVATCFNQYAHQQVMSQPDHFINTAITAIKEALAQEQESDKFVMDIECTKCGAKQSGILTVNTSPPQRTWVGLTWEEIDECFKITPDQYLPAQIYRRIEAKLKRKNGFAEEKNT